MVRGKRGDRDPDKPKRPESAYFLWLKENRAELSKKYPGLQQCDFVKKAGKEWVALKDKSKWEKRAKAAMTKYQEKMVEYRRKNADNKPKRPLSAFFIYMNKNREELKKRYPGISVCNLTQEASKEWKALQDKSEWEELAKEASAEYQKKMAEYKEANPDAPDCSGCSSGTKRKQIKRKADESASAVSKRRRKKSTVPGDKRRRRKPSPSAEKRRRRKSVPGDKRRRRKAASPSADKRRRRKSVPGDKRRRRKAASPSADKRRRRKSTGGDKRRRKKPDAGKRR